MRIGLPPALRGYLAEPAVPDPPRRVWRDWALVAAALVGGSIEAALRTDDQWAGLPLGWQFASVVILVAAVPWALLHRRTRSLQALVGGFGAFAGLGIAMAIGHGTSGGLIAGAVLLVVPYALFRWGSGRDGALGVPILVAVAIIGNTTDSSTGQSEWIGGTIVLTIPCLVGLLVRYRSAARERAIEQVKSRERAELARDLHDTVAHHVSAIAVQAQAGQALAATDPERALSVLAVIEQAASHTLRDMRVVVGSLRDGGAAELAPQPCVADLNDLARSVPGEIEVEVDVSDRLGAIGSATGTALYRIAQESITNSVRHARNASRVTVRLASDGDLVRLTVVDDGEAPESSGVAGYGLVGMAERAALLGGRLRAGPAPPDGWVVTAELPRGLA